jgi:hypothetical protein
VIDERVLGCLAVFVGGGFRPPKATLIITQYRVVLAQRTKPLEQAHKAMYGGGGGLFSRGPKGPDFIDRYLSMPPDAALAETPGNSMLVWQQLQMVQVFESERPGDEDSAPEQYLLINFVGPGIKLELASYPPYPRVEVIRDALRQGFGGLVLE